MYSEGPLLSIILPAHNSEKFLDYALRSVALGNPLIEIIVVNDGSTDSTEEVVVRWKQKHPEIILVSQENRGLSFSRNVGVSLAQGRYGLFLDSDDQIDLSLLITLVSEHCVPEDLDLLLFDTEPFLWDDSGSNELLKRYSAYYRRSSRVHQEVTAGSTLAQSLVDHQSYLVSSCLYVWRREFVLENGLSFSDGVLMEDNFFTYACLKKANRAKYAAQKIHRRSLRPKSLSQSSREASMVQGYLDAHGSILRLQQSLQPVEDWESKALQSTVREASKRVAFLSEKEIQQCRVGYESKFGLKPPI